MAGIIIPGDRFNSNRPTGYCRNPECLEGGEFRYEFPVDNDRFCCPKCGANQSPMVGLLVLTHLLTPDKKGPVLGQGGIRYRIACNKKRSDLATTTNMEAASGDVSAVNCPGCLKAAHDQKLAQVSGWSLNLEANK